MNLTYFCESNTTQIKEQVAEPTKKKKKKKQEIELDQFRRKKKMKKKMNEWAKSFFQF